VAERADFDELVRRLEPFWKVVPRAVPRQGRDTLSALQLLGELRNRTVGHGAVGWALALEPRPYLAAAHGFFLQLMQPFADVDFGIYAGRDGETVGRDRGLELFGQADAGCLVLSYATDGEVAAVLDPFACFVGGELYLLHRLRGKMAEYMHAGIPSDAAPPFRSAPLHVDAFFDVEPLLRPQF
jgi:hypothetical protein